jgi:hypothetical protein
MDTFKIIKKDKFEYYNNLMHVSNDDIDVPFHFKNKICLLDVIFI